MASSKQTVEVEGRKLQLSNLDKLLYPVAKFSKADIISYYLQAAKYLLPHLRDRPVTLLRYPEGVAAEHFYEKDAPRYTPDWVATFPVPRRAGGPDIRYILINDIATLVWCTNLANIEIHPFLHRVPEIQQPTYVVFDLDPGEGAEILDCAEVAFLLRDLFGNLKLKSFVKSSGSKGLQLYVPLNTPVSYAVTQPFARAVAQYLAREHPKGVVAEMDKSLRGGKVFVDWSQNSDFKTTVGVYSLRAKRTTPFVSFPVAWDVLEEAVGKRSHEQLYLHPAGAIERLEKEGDLFAPVLSLQQELPESFEERHLRAAASSTMKKTSQSGLGAYSAKRDFSKTPEPSPPGAAPRSSRQGSRRRFVIQKHAASHLHYDLRIEVHGVLKSWAVPKGLPYKDNEKRLAMATEDHPLEYFDFEGVIPAGQYGGGTVMVWDAGACEIIEGNYYKGFLRVFLDGKKLKGEWTLTKDSGADRNWSLVKTGGGIKTISPRAEDLSALSGRSMAEIAEQRTKEWHSNRGKGNGSQPAETRLVRLPDAKIGFVPPMQARLVSELPRGADWVYEIKLDGYRALAIKHNGRVRLLSRNNNDLSGRYPSIAGAFAALEDDTILDGEIVSLDEKGRPSFHRLQHNLDPLFYYVFDLLAFQGKSTLHLALRDRRALLTERALRGLTDPVRLCPALSADADQLIVSAKSQDVEGLVAKRSDSRYEAGQRSGAWVKYKTSQGQELVIGGYMPGGRYFESLLAGYYEGDRLMFIGKVRNGFVERTKAEVARRFRGLGTAECPFANLPEPRNARRGEALTAQVMRKCCWLKPQLVARIDFADWTAGNHLRHSRFVALRDDKDAREVTHEVPGQA